ncbi:MAG: flagellar hook-basal body complex protein FliE [Mariprofundaceae bacterium]
MNIHSAGGITPQLPSQQSAPQRQGNFAALMKHYVAEVNQESKAASAAGADLALGKSENVSETLLAIQKAQLSFQLMLGVRNKLVDAYREVMRMQV